MKKEIYDKLDDNVNKNLFEVDFEFDDLSKNEKNILKETIIKINENSFSFDLFLVDKLIQPLDILVKLYTNKITGDVRINMHDKDGVIFGTILFKTLKIMKINNLIDFDYESIGSYKETKKDINVEVIYDDILYSNNNIDFDKLT